MKCPCGKGLIVEENYSNDWFQSYDKYSISCDECKEKYHVEEVGYTKSDGEYRSTAYLVPIGETLNYNSGSSYNIYDTPFYIQLCMDKMKNELVQAYEVLKESKYFSRLEDREAISICNLSKRSLGSVKVKVVLPHLIEAIENYDSIDNNYERKKLRLAQEKLRVAKTKEKSICLYDLEEMK